MRCFYEVITLCGHFGRFSHFNCIIKLPITIDLRMYVFDGKNKTKLFRITYCYREFNHNLCSLRSVKTWFRQKNLIWLRSLFYVTEEMKERTPS